jgi:hypothetical protein
MSFDNTFTEEKILYLQAFINSVDRQRGNSLSEEEADDLIDYAKNIINSF